MSANACLPYSLGEIIEMPLHEDERGWLFEIVSRAHPFDAEQVYAVQCVVGKPRGQHYHTRKTEVFAVVSGQVHLRLRHVKTGERATIILGPRLASEEPGMQPTPAVARAIRIPPFIWHEFEAIGAGEYCQTAVVIAVADEYYDPEDEDTHRDATSAGDHYHDG